MMNILIAGMLLLLVPPRAAAATESLYFDELMQTFADEADYRQAREAAGVTADFKLKEAHYWWVKASVIYTSTVESRDDPAVQSDPEMMALVPENDRHNLNLAFDLATAAMRQYESLWATEKKNNRLNVLYAYGILEYVGIGSELKRLDMGTIQELYFKARNLVNVVVSRLPDNLNARYLRLLMTFDIPAATGMRPDSVILEDSRRFLADYSLLPEELRASGDYLMYLNQVRLIRAYVLGEGPGRSEAKTVFAQVDADALKAGVFKKLYQQVERKLR